jgi:hypothetical protein
MRCMYNTLCNKQDGLFFFSMSYLNKGQGRSMSSKRCTNDLISSICVYFMATFSYSILFYNIHNILKGFDKFQGYFIFI